MILQEKSEIEAEFGNEYIVKKELESLSDKELRNFDKAAESGNFWKTIDSLNDYRNTVNERRLGLDAAKMIADKRNIELEEQDGILELKEKIARNVKAGVPRSKLGEHFYMDGEELRENIHGGIRSAAIGLYNPDTPRIIDEAHEGKDTRQISEVLEIPQETVAKKMDKAGYDSFTREDTFEATRGYELNTDIDPEAAIYWLLDRKEKASGDFISDFLEESANFSTEPYEMDQILGGLQEEGILNVTQERDPYSGLENRDMYSLGSSPEGTSLEKGQEELLEEVVEYEMS